MLFKTLKKHVQSNGFGERIHRASIIVLWWRMPSAHFQLEGYCYNVVVMFITYAHIGIGIFVYRQVILSVKLVIGFSLNSEDTNIPGFRINVTLIVLEEK